MIKHGNDEKFKKLCIHFEGLYELKLYETGCFLNTSAAYEYDLLQLGCKWLNVMGLEESAMIISERFGIATNRYWPAIL